MPLAIRVFVSTFVCSLLIMHCCMAQTADHRHESGSELPANVRRIPGYRDMMQTEHYFLKQHFLVQNRTVRHKAGSNLLVYRVVLLEDKARPMNKTGEGVPHTVVLSLRCSLKNNGDTESASDITITPGTKK